MDHTYQRPLQLPAGYAVLSAEEMTYTEGGALSINITPQQVMAFGMTVTVNLLGMMGQRYDSSLHLLKCAKFMSK